MLIVHMCFVFCEVYVLACLSLFGLLLTDSMDWVAYKHQKFISPNYGGWEVQDQSAGKSGVWSKPTFTFIHDHLLAVSSHGSPLEYLL